ncbi:hypothetical protein VJJ45_05645 [Capnocytophaga gingivalis]|nr:hypothetical protein [Capnocytophaga gingivalis]
MSITTSTNGVKMVAFSEYTKVCFSMLMQDLIANIKPNPRNGEQPDVYFDEELYKNRFKIEQANGWLDEYKGLIMRYEYLDETWIGILLLGFISKFLKKV